jgi:phospholipid-binding lipoprotein MlaA
VAEDRHRLRTSFMALALAFLTVPLAGCASTRSDTGATTEGENYNDPAEGMNRKLFVFGQGLDNAVIKPVAQGYGELPRTARKGLRNFVRNLAEPVTFANDVLQAKPSFAFGTLARFSINSTFGLLGFVDVATDLGIIRHSEDFGQTLAVWGVPEGPYFFAPILGPLPPRDLVGLIADMALNPLSWAGDDWVGYLNTGKFLVDGIDTRERAIETVEDLERTSLDYYATVRNLYRQNREFQINDGQSEFDDLPDFDEFD